MTCLYTDVDVDNTCLRENVVLHVLNRTERFCTNKRRRHTAGKLSYLFVAFIVC